jgi:DNA-binding NtrC family response regulator
MLVAGKNGQRKWYTMESNLNHIANLLQVKFGIIGSSAPMLKSLQLLYQAAPTDLAVLITGETGTGKEVFANAIHGLSHRKKFPFVSVNCGAIPETLLESELFGHEKGAFTGASDQRKGFFEVANKGTIFLDEIGEMPVSTQVKLLRVLESGEFSRLGSSIVHQVDIRLVAATNRELELEVMDGNFRQDLYFRLKSVHIKLPPLREHNEDIEDLVMHFGKRTCDKMNLQFEGISNDALLMMKAMPWPGNVRELRNVVETVLTLERKTYITPELIRRYISPALPPPAYSEIDRGQSIIPLRKQESGERIELELIFRTLLEMQNQFSDMQRGMHSLAMKIDNIQNKIVEINDLTIPTINIDTPKFDDDKDLNLANNEKELIISALNKFSGSRRLAAQALGISERTLYRKLDDYNIDL